MDDSKFDDRFSFIQDYNTIVMMPHPHLNIINCVGMGQKHDYLMWRRKNGFFTALDKLGNLLTWSLLNGKLLYVESYEEKSRRKQHRSNVVNIDYEVYRGDDEDITYTRDFYNYPDRSI